MKKIKFISILAAGFILLAISSCKKNTTVETLSFDCANWSSISTNTTIPAGVYNVSCNIEVSNGATLTISPGTTLMFTQNASLVVDAGASLTAAGTSSAPIVLEGTQNVPGYWQGIILNSISINNTFTYCTISNGGATTGNQFGANVTMSNASAAFTNCTIKNSSDAGIYIVNVTPDNTYFNSFSNNTLTGNGSYPVIAYARAAGSIGAGNSFSGNTNNYIGILSSEVTVNISLSAQPVPYLFMQTGSDQGVTFDKALTIAPGTNIALGSGISILGQTTGSIYAVGTSTSPITFTGQQATAGFWGSVMVTSQSSLNNFQYCNFSYGGGIPGSPLTIYEASKGMLSTYMYIPAARSINVVNCSFANSGSSGIYVSATDGPPTIPPTYNSNIITANTFTNCNPNVQE